MPLLLKLDIAGAKPLRHGSEWFWSVMLEKTADGQTVTFDDVDRAGDPYQEGALRDFFKRMVAAGYIERIEGRPVRYRLIRRQRDCPIISNDGELSTVGAGRQNMWNVMRRARAGFTVMELVVSASTDDVQVSVANAKKYVLRLQRAGLLRIVSKAKPGQTGNTYTLLGSANTGPKAPRIHDTTMVYDPNKGTVVGPVIAEEDRT
ncbi:hypothetical protein ACXHXM_02155